MGFHDVRFPLLISYRSRGGPGFRTHQFINAGANRSSVPRWAQPLYGYDIVFGRKKRDVMHEFVKFYAARLGPANSFRFFDHADHTSAANGRDTPSDTDVLIGTGDGTTVDFQLKKVYASGSETLTRLITKPIHNETLGVPYSTTYNVVISLNNAPLASGWTVNTTTGIVTFTTPPGAGVAVKAGFAFDVPVSFAQELDDDFKPEMADFDVTEMDSLRLIEDRSPLVVYEEVNYGGAKYLGILTNQTYQLSALEGRVVSFTAQAGGSGVTVRLPSFTSLPPGGPYFYLYNLGGTASATIKDSTGALTIGTVASGQLVTVVLGLDGGGSKVWLVS